MFEKTKINEKEAGVGPFFLKKSHDNGTLDVAHAFAFSLLLAFQSNPIKLTEILSDPY